MSSDLPAAREKPRIVVDGDVCIDWLAWPTCVADRSTVRHNWQLVEGMQMKAVAGGAWLLRELVQQTAGGTVTGPRMLTNLDAVPSTQALHSFIELKRSEAKPGVWRVSKYRGFAGPDEPILPHPIDGDDPEAELVVLDDVGNGFRDSADWPAALDREPKVIWKTSRPFSASKLLDLLRSKHAVRTLVVLSADHLRQEGAQISRGYSWERTLCDLFRSLEEEPAFDAFKDFAGLVVLLGSEAAVYVERSNREISNVHFAFAQEEIEGSMETMHKMKMFGVTSVFTACLAASALNPKEWPEPALGKALACLRATFTEGLGHGEKPGDLLANCNAGNHKLTTCSLKPEEVSGTNFSLGLPERKKELYELAVRSAFLGADEVLQGVPVVKFGKLSTVDRHEIETFRAVRELIDEYLSLRDPSRPLCIGVFGPPGSGKSFGIKQLASGIEHMETLEFNVSQFELSDQLISAFHSVRDSVVRRKIPLAFFDEFDGGKGGEPLGWLKHFIAPMQDGEFRHGDLVHRIGRAILVFAGGTHSRFQDFGTRSDEAFRLAKGPDFVSRLRGYVDVRGVDRRDPGDGAYVLRRALLLRSLFAGKGYGDLFDPSKRLRIDEGVLRAFLLCRKYRHGARSMEAIIDMSRLMDKECFDRSSLPSMEQLDLHVDAEDFMFAVNERDGGGIEAQLANIAEAIHERFRRREFEKIRKGDPASKDPNDDSLKPWADLPANYRRDNLAQANSYSEKLESIGYGMRRAARPIDPISFTESEVELLAEAEHVRWMKSKEAQGYSYAPGPKSDKDPKTHPNLVPWNDPFLTDGDKDKDREACRDIPENLAEAGYEIFKLAPILS